MTLYLAKSGIFSFALEVQYNSSTRSPTPLISRRDSRVKYVIKYS